MKKLAVAAASLGLLGSSWAQVTERVSVASSGAEADAGADLPSPPGAVVSADGRYVAFRSAATNIIPGDTNPLWDVILRDRQSGITELVSLNSQGTQGIGSSGLYGIAITPDARYIAFQSGAGNLVPGDTNGTGDILVRDRASGTTERVSVATSGIQGNGTCFHLAISDDGRFVAFESVASNLVQGDANGEDDVFVHDRVQGTTEIVSISTNGVQGNGYSGVPAISGDGRFVAFESLASTLVPGDTNGRADVFVRDLQHGTTQRVSVRADTAQSNGHSLWPAISANGRYVAFTSEATNLILGDTNARSDVFLRDRRDGTIERVSVGIGGVQGNGNSQAASMSADGRFVVFESGATNLVTNPTSGSQTFLRDRLSGTTQIVSVASDGSLSNGVCDQACLSQGGRYVVFRSTATNLVPGDTNAHTDVFVHDSDATGFASLCDPGTAGVIPCPCSNPPSAPGHGCDNSSSTGGALLSAAGIAYLAIDSLVFTTSGEPPTATSILLQGNAPAPFGLIFGQGIRCAGGTIKRLFTKTATGGSITAPDLAAGDPTISSRSAARGDVIQPGQSRWYLVYYRDLNVLGGCSAISSFNSTQTGQVSWWP